MKRKIIITVILMLCICSVNAQWTSKKTAIDISSDYTTDSENIFSITKKDHKPETPDYVIVQSDVEIPITYDAVSYSDHNMLDTEYVHNRGLAADLPKAHSAGGKSEALFQSFAVFTIVDTNELEIPEVQEDTSHLKEDLDKYLPKGFDAYKGMFSDKINAETMLNPITSF